MTARILLADDHRILRDGLRNLIESKTKWTVCGEAADGVEAVERAVALQPAVIVMDVDMPRLNGSEATVQVCAKLPHVRVVALSVHTDAAIVARMLRPGARGFVPKASAYEELVTAIGDILAGKVYVSPLVTGLLVDEFILPERRLPEIAGLDALTATERLVLQRIASGLHSKEIAAEMGISPRTVDSHRAALSQKLNAGGIADLTRIAIRHGLADANS